MPKILIAALALFGLMALAAALANTSGRAEPGLSRADSVLPPPSAHLFYLNTAHARRFIRWDCSDWQPRPAVADADNQLASSILETLAENRGKTLYCALDQSDTWTKRQVHDHAHAHNDRDRTQYDGSQGQGRFRGFTAGQEGWLTDGEHGITGVSPERIFEFPQEERRRRKKTVTLRKKVSSEPADTGSCPDRGGLSGPTAAITDMRDINTVGGDLLCTAYGAVSHPSSWEGQDSARHRARNRVGGAGGNAGSNGWGWHWRTRAKTGTTGPDPIAGNTRSEAEWIAAAETAVRAACADLGGGYKYQRGSADFGPGHNRQPGTGLNNVEDKGDFHGWFFAYERHDTSVGNWKARARESRAWHGTCFKKVRR